MVKNSFFEIFSAMKAGFYDGINPCSGATFLLFLVILSWIGYTRKRVLIFGSLFFVSSIFVQYFSAVGLFDYTWIFPVYVFWTRIAYFSLAAIFYVIGFLDFSDRVSFRKHGDIAKFRMPVPEFFLETKNPRQDSSWLNMLVLGFTGILIFLIAGLLNFGSSIYPQGEYIFILHSQLMAGSSGIFTLCSVLLYCIMILFFPIAGWFAIIWMSNGAKKSNGVILFYKNILSALFLSIGIGLSIFFLSNYN